MRRERILGELIRCMIIGELAAVLVAALLEADMISFLALHYAFTIIVWGIADKIDEHKSKQGRKTAYKNKVRKAA